MAQQFHRADETGGMIKRHIIYFTWGPVLCIHAPYEIYVLPSVPEKCHACKEEFPAEGVTILDAMGKTWHVECFRYIHICVNVCECVKCLCIHGDVSNSLSVSHMFVWVCVHVHVTYIVNIHRNGLTVVYPHP